MDKQIKEEFWKSIEQYGFMIDKTYEMVIMIDLRDGACQIASFRQKFFKIPKKELLYEHIYQKMLDKVDERDRRVFEKCSLEKLRLYGEEDNRNKIIIPYRYKCKSKQEIWLENTVVQEFLHDQVMLMLVKEISSEVDREQASRKRTELFENLSQDIRIPLYTIMGVNDICTRHLNNPIKVKEYLEKQKIAINHLMNIVSDIDGMSKNDISEMKMKQKDFNLPDVMKDIIIILQQRCLKRGIDFKVSYQGLVHEHLCGDEFKISRMLLNILGNVMKYARFKDEILLQVNEIPVSDSRFAEYEFCIFNNYEFFVSLYEEYKDDSDVLEQLWTRENESEPELITIREMIRQMGGKLFYNIEPGIGTMLVVKLKIKISKGNDKLQCKWDCKGKKVLVADDSDSILQWMDEMLSGLEMDVTLCKGSRTAVNIAYEAVKESVAYDLIILPWKMKEMDGIETANLLRKILGYQVPIIMQSAYEWSDIEFEARNVGVNFFAVKPLTRSSLLPILDKLNHNVEAMEEETKIPDFSGKHVLLVESDRNYCEIIAECLKDVSITCEVAQSGKQAVEIMMVAEENEFDLILMETEMPLLNGYDATRMIRKLPGEYNSNIPIVAIGEKSAKKDMLRLARAGMNGQIKKPIELRDLYETLNGYLQS